ncbi:MAG: hypothetical protein OHK0023_08500 [Anaerolineae bacterium]
MLRVVSLICLFAWMPIVPAIAQVPTIALLQPTTGFLRDSSATQAWRFQGRGGERLSAQITATSGDLLPALRLIASDGTVLAESEGYTSLGTSTLEDFLIPSDGEYTLRALSQFGGGKYTVLLLPGFAYLQAQESFDNGTTIFRTWRTETGLSQLNASTLLMQLRSTDRYAYTTADRLGATRDAYFQADLTFDQVGATAQAGLIFRATSEGPLQGYLFSVNGQRQWQFARVRDGVATAIQNWTPLYDKAAETLSLGVLARGSVFDLYVNGIAVGTVSDISLRDPGALGLYMSTGEIPDNYVSVRWDNAVVTLPAGSSSQSILSPNTLAAWAGDPSEIVSELRTAKILPGIGVSAFDDVFAFVTSTTTGIVFTPLATDVQFTDFIFGADVIWEADKEGIACAFGLRAVEDRFILVYFDRRGGVGVRDSSGALNRYDVFSAAALEDRASNRLLVVARSNVLLAYLNGVRVAHVAVESSTGRIYIAAFNYEIASTACRFRNTWLRRL